MLDNLLLFVQVVKSGGLLAVAKKSELPASTISRRLKNLEQELEYELFARSGKGLVLTTAGESLYQQFAHYSLQLEQRLLQLQQEADAIIGELSVLLPYPLASQAILPYIPAFLIAHPGLKLNLSFQFNYEDMHKEPYDILLYLNLPQQNAHKVMAMDKMIAVCSKEYAHQHGVPQQLTELLQHRLIGNADMEKVSTPSIRVYNQDRFYLLPNNMKLRANNNLMAKKLVTSGYGIGGVVQHLVKDEIERGELIHVLPTFHFGIITYDLLSKLDSRDRRYQAFLKFIVECIERVIPPVNTEFDITQIAFT